ncbi:hypothetical protein OV079_42210 [Nannocystis pusilla]|uniref:Uncharacterized protein n=1 Tax=Nannocystis pusilla TaxID=889268 RepID=A0A9X3EX82_9BACT|nr:hypothetical protein [Nannocystis pusilla]MCY1012053.1 hypothetical protein [Nannocystis pusilla]
MEELPFAVENKGVLPVVSHRRLILVWPKTELVPKPPKKEENYLYHERKVTIRWAERQFSQWGKIHTVGESATTDWPDTSSNPDPEDPDFNEDISMVSWTDQGGLQVGVNRAYEYLFEDRMKKLAQWSYNGCSGSLHWYGFGDQDDDAKIGDLEGPWPVPSPHSEVYFQAFGLGGGPGKLLMPFESNKGLAYSGPILKLPGGVYKFLSIPHQDERLDCSRPFIYSDKYASLYLRPSNSGAGTNDANPDKLFLQQIGQNHLQPYFGLAGITVPYQAPPADNQLVKELSGGDNIASMQQWGSFGKYTKYSASVFYHPYTCLFLERVRRFGVAGLLDPAVATQGGDVSLQYQAVDQPLAPDHEYFDDETIVYQEYPTADIDFRYGGAYSVYNWELFFHIPMYIADRLMAENRFEEAQRWLGYIFDPTRNPQEVGNTDCLHYWNFKEFRESSSTCRSPSCSSCCTTPAPTTSSLARRRR